MFSLKVLGITDLIINNASIEHKSYLQLFITTEFIKTGLRRNYYFKLLSTLSFIKNK